MSTGAQDSGHRSDTLSRALLPLLGALFAGGLALSAVQLQRNHEILIERTAIQHAAVYADTLDKMRDLYATEVVETARKTDIRISHDYLTEPNAIPLPITLSRRFEENPPHGVTTRMYSPFPFEFPDQQMHGGLRDDFGRDAWKAFNVPPADRPESFARVETVGGVKTLRYAIAEPMKEQCVSCHNDYAGSPKTDWKVDDVRGVLEVAYPLTQAAELAQSSIWETLGTLTPMLLLAMALLALATREQRRHTDALQKRVHAQQQAQETMAENADLRSRIDRQTQSLLKSRLELLGNDERLFQVLESMPLGVLVVDTRGDTTYANERAVALLGESGVFDGPWGRASADGGITFHAAGAVERTPFSALPPAAALRGESVGGMNLELQTEGARVPVLLSAAPIFDLEGAVKFAIVTIQDVSDEKRLEQQARQAQRMQAVGRLAGGVAHDFNNLLTAILSFATYAMEGLDPEHEAHADLQQVLKAAGRGESLTRQLLAFSRHRAQGSTHVTAPNPAIASVEQMLRRLLGEDVNLQTVLGEVPNIRLDSGSLDQVIINLAVNARDAMPRGGQLTIETSAVTLDAATIRRRGLDLAPGAYVRIAVSDDGVGMDEPTQRHMFDPFFTTKSAGHGTGLGLSTCWGIVRQAAGHIAVDTKLDRGTTIEIFLPAADEPATELVQEVGAIPSARGATVLVAEDDATVRALVVRRLTHDGFRVLEAADGKEAAEICDAMAPGTIDLLLTDVVMPIMNGPELVRLAGQRHPDMLVVYMSGYTDDIILQHGVHQSSIRLLQKPFTPDALARKVWKVLASTDPQPSA